MVVDAGYTSDDWYGHRRVGKLYNRPGWGDLHQIQDPLYIALAALDLSYPRLQGCPHTQSPRVAGPNRQEGSLVEVAGGLPITLEVENCFIGPQDTGQPTAVADLFRPI